MNTYLSIQLNCNMGKNWVKLYILSLCLKIYSVSCVSSSWLIFTKRKTKFSSVCVSIYMSSRWISPSVFFPTCLKKLATHFVLNFISLRVFFVIFLHLCVKELIHPLKKKLFGSVLLSHLAGERDHEKS